MTTDPTTTIMARGGPDPAWARVAATIEREIREHGAGPGARLESERALCERLGVSRVTLRKALAVLVESGAVTPSHGRGWFVGTGHAPRRTDWPNTLESFSETAARYGLRATSRLVTCTVAPATIDEAEQLHVAPGSPLHHLDRIRLLEGVPVARDRSRIPADLIEIDAARMTEGSLYTELTRAGHPPARAQSTIEAHPASQDLADELQIAPGDPVLVMDQVVTTAEGVAVLASVIEYAGERYRLRTVFARAPEREPGAPPPRSP